MEIKKPDLDYLGNWNQWESCFGTNIYENLFIPEYENLFHDKHIGLYQNCKLVVDFGIFKKEEIIKLIIIEDFGDQQNFWKIKICLFSDKIYPELFKISTDLEDILKNNIYTDKCLLSLGINLEKIWEIYYFYSLECQDFYEYNNKNFWNNYENIKIDPDTFLYFSGFDLIIEDPKTIEDKITNLKFSLNEEIKYLENQIQEKIEIIELNQNNISETIDKIRKQCHLLNEIDYLNLRYWEVLSSIKLNKKTINRFKSILDSYNSKIICGKEKSDKSNLLKIAKLKTELRFINNFDFNKITDIDSKIKSDIIYVMNLLEMVSIKSGKYFNGENINLGNIYENINDILGITNFPRFMI